MITSTSNQQVKTVIRLQNYAKERKAQHAFLAEGIRLLQEIPVKWLLKVYVSESFCNHPQYLPLYNSYMDGGVECIPVSDAVFKRMSGTQAPQGILGIVRQPVYRLADLLQGSGTHLLVLEGVQDPGNLGTIFRTGEGAGVTGVVMDAQCVDVFAPKTVRATMGSICRVPFYQAEDLLETIQEIKRHQVTVYAAHIQGEQMYDAFDYRKGTAFLIGNEGNGLTQQALGQADAYLRIPMCGRLESLNAAMAAGILVYEANRQRRSP